MPRPRVIRGQGEADWKAHIDFMRSPKWKKGCCPCKLCLQKAIEDMRDTRLQEELPGAVRAKETLESFEKEFGAIEQHDGGEEFYTERGRVLMRSQKARGLAILGKHWGIRKPTWLHASPIEGILPYHGHGKEFDNLKFPLFARPCPTRPRHGFVESRMVHDGKELLHLLCETLAADPKGEVMLTQQLTGRAGAIATDTGVVWAKGNAGATSGKGKQYTIPVPRVENGFTWAMKKRNTVLEKDILAAAYIEAVENHGNVIITQLRDGPRMEAVSGNYVPFAKYEVNNVITPEDGEETDLLAWEKEVNKAIPGTVIHLPGSSLTSHFAVHGIAKGIAVITDREPPSKGDKLSPADTQPASLTGKDFHTIARHLARPLLKGGKRSRAAFAVSVLHAMPAWGNAPHLLALRAHGADTLARLLVAACAGEARFYYQCGEGYYLSDSAPATPWRLITGRPLTRYKGAHRHVIFEKTYNLPMRIQRAVAAGCEADFTRYWGEDEPDHKTGYGGIRWRKSARIAKDLCDALLAFRKEPSATTWAAVLVAYNAGVNAVHNGGRLLDKWAERDEIDLAATCPQWGLLAPQVMHLTCGIPLPFGLAEKYGLSKTKDNLRLDSFLLPGYKKHKKGKKKKKPAAPAVLKYKPGKIAKDAKNYAAAVKKLKAMKVPGPYTVLQKGAPSALIH